MRIFSGPSETCGAPVIGMPPEWKPTIQLGSKRHIKILDQGEQ